MPWTSDFLLIWVPLTLLIGVAIAAYLSSVSRQQGALKPAVTATLALWVPSTVGMLGWAELSVQVFVLDSVVNLLAALLASLAAAWSLVHQKAVPRSVSILDAQQSRKEDNG